MLDLFKLLGIGFFSAMLCASMPTAVFSSSDRDIYDEVDTSEPGKTIRGTVVSIDELGSQRWDVSVKNGATGEVVILHIDNMTHRRDMQMKPIIGNNVLVKYNETSKHAITFLTDARLAR
jgi:hypothetical protein